MALTSAQQTKVIQLLGYPGKSLDSTSVLYDKVLSDRLQSLGSDVEALAVSYLTSIAAIETQILAAPARFIAEKVGDISLNTNEIEKLRKERKKLTIELGSLLDVPYIGSSGVSISVVC